jgi:ParB family chromosome partitioning protein
MVDEGKIAFRPAVEISQLPLEKQKALFETMRSEDCTPSLEQAQKMRRHESSGELTDDAILFIMSEQKPNQTPKFKLPHERIKKFFPASYTPKQIEDTIIKLLEDWQVKREKSRSAESR